MRKHLSMRINVDPRDGRIFEDEGDFIEVVHRSSYRPSVFYKVLLLLLLSFPLYEANATTCGPHMLTYAVYDANGNQAEGIRCVKLTWARGIDPLPPIFTNAGATFFWYGEGKWGSKIYRHVGNAFLDMELPYVEAADIYGNGESTSGVFDNLQVSIVGNWPAPTEIRVTGGWNENWKLVQDIDYTPLPRPLTCGPNFHTYVVESLPGGAKGGGIRCHQKNNYGAWIGIGDWYGLTYFHLGWKAVEHFEGAGAVDLCDSAFGNFCEAVPKGSLSVSDTDWGGFAPLVTVSGAWSEGWTHGTVATYSPTHKAPYCSSASAACTSGASTKGRSTRGPESNAPNTIDGCADGNYGIYHIDESIESLSVTTLDGSTISQGKTVRIDAKVWAYSVTMDYLDLYYSSDANNPNWIYIGTMMPFAEGESTLSGTYTVPYSGSQTQAIRAQFRFGGNADACSIGEYSDRDDLVFTVAQ